MIGHLDSVFQNCFDLEKELKTSERSKISLVRDKETRKRHICLQFTGSSEVYRKMQGIDCPYLPNIEEVIEQDGQTMVLEEYIQGDTLAYLLEERPLPEELVRPIAIQVCQALETLHSIGIVHRDIKPENIILRGDEAVLIDFDASRVSKPERVTDTQVMGTTGYAAPEQYGFAQTDARADIYAFGVLLNEMLTRQHPARALAQGNLTPIIEKCIEVNMDKRYGSAKELLTALEKPVQPAKPSRRKLWLLLPAVLLIAAAIWAGILWENPDSTQPDALPQESEKTDNDTAEPPDVSLQQRKLSWNGDLDIYGTTFHYDLDEDGEREEYVFAAMFNFVDEPRLLQNSGTAIDDKPEVLEVVGAVWKQIGEKIYEPVEAFAPLLSSTTVTVRQIEGEHEGIVEEIGTLYGIWPGAIRATFEYVGLWYYECSAVLAGETLTAVGSTRTELLSEAAASAEPYMTPFQYDLDGDGTTEQYWFGAVFHINDGMSLIKNDHTRTDKGTTYRCKVAPAVWRLVGSDEYERMDAFAPLLEDAKVTLRCISGKQQPTVDDIGTLFGWSGAVQVNYTDNGSWLYECSATFADQTLTAAATTSYTALGTTYAQTGVEYWTGEAAAHTTPFQYDLDGDGITEDYLFGIVICGGEDRLRFSEERLGIPFSAGKSVNNRTAAPMVWRQTDGGAYETMEGFAPLLEDATITLWCVEGETQPDVWAEGDLLGIWPNAIRVTYTTEGTWLYECTLTLDGQALTATSVTTTYFT